MKIEKFSNPSSCAACANQSFSLKLEKPLTKDMLTFFSKNGFQEAQNFTNSGIFYIENVGLVATGMMGNTTLTVKCKNKNCQNFINSLEELLSQI